MMETRCLYTALELWGVIFCFISAWSVQIAGEKQERGKYLFPLLFLCNAFLLLADATAWLFGGHPGALGKYVVHISNFVIFIMGYVMLLAFTEYLVLYIGQDTKAKRRWRKSIWGLALVAMVLVIISQFNHMFYYFDTMNIYHGGKLLYLTQLLGIIGVGISTVVLIQYRKLFDRTQFFTLMSYNLFPFLAIITQWFIHGLTLLNISFTISVFWLLGILQFERGKRLKEQGEQLVTQAEQLMKQERELGEMQKKIMLSQIQPHFLYNALNTIYHLCEVDIKVAQDAIIYFSEYLRGNLESLNQKGTIEFSEEMRHVEGYLFLEKLRFDEKLELKYNIEVTDFKLPALTIQPIVENAVKHGVGKTPDGGVVSISTRRAGKDIEILVEDNGVGFDPTEIAEDGRSHIGIENVKQRLFLLCQATIFIASEPGKGTRVTIHLPQQSQ